MLVLAGAMATATRAAALPPPGTITPVGSISNPLYRNDPPDSNSKGVGMLADPVNHDLIVYPAQTSICPRVLDTDTFAVKGVATPTGGSCSWFQGVNQSTQLSLGVAAAIDPVDHVVVATSNQGGPLGISGEFFVYAEDSLKLLATWNLPPQGNPTTSPQHQITGVSWYAPLDELLVVTGNYGTNTGGWTIPGVSVTAYAMGPSIKTLKPVVLWSALIPGCDVPLIPQFASAAAVHATSERAVYVPCVLALGQLQADQFTTVERDGVVKVPLVDTGCAPPATECPDTANEQAAAAPGVGSDTVFDPVADRIFMVSNDGDQSLSTLVYSGHLNQFLGSVVVGLSLADANTVKMGFDSTTGRFYVVDTLGLVTVDSRRTPMAPGSVFPQYAQDLHFAPPAVSIVLPPDRAYPYTRVLVNHERFLPGSNTDWYMPDFTVYADTLSVSADPPADNVDSRTLHAAPPASAAVQKTFEASASGYGWHSDLVGGPNDVAGVLPNVNGLFSGSSLAFLTVNLPLGQGNRDLLAGSVSRLDLRNGGVDGATDALGAADDTTAFNLQQCTDARAVVTCIHPPQPPKGPPVGSPPAPVQPTGQLPPFPAATCSQPGAADQGTQTFDGAYSTSWTADPNNPGQYTSTQSQIPGTDQTQAHATADCRSGGTGAAWLRAGGIGASGAPSFQVAQATTTAQVVPPDGNGATSTVSASASGVEIDLGSGSAVSHISIASVSQKATTTAAGLPGTAKATDLVSMSGVSVNGAPLCTTQCDPSAVAAVLNQAFPYLIHVEAPKADDSFMTGCVSAAGGQQSCLGSPGGYEAAVEANRVEQLGDHDFNGMGTTEAAILPALRVILYFPNDGNPARTREVLDLAGVSSTSTQGLSVLPSFTNLPTPALIQAVQAATGTSPSSYYVPGTPGSTGTIGAPLGTGGQQYAGGPLGIIERTFTGLAWLLRSPLGSLQMIAFLAVLGVPVALARRRGMAAR